MVVVITVAKLLVLYYTLFFEITDDLYISPVHMFCSHVLLNLA